MPVFTAGRCASCPSVHVQSSASNHEPDPDLATLLPLLLPLRLARFTLSADPLQNLVHLPIVASAAAMGKMRTPNAVAPFGPRSIVCQQSRTRSRSRHAASAAALSATALQLLPADSLCCLPRCTFFAELSLRWYILHDARNPGFLILPATSFVTPFVISTNLHDSSDWTPRINVSI